MRLILARFRVWLARLSDPRPPAEPCGFCRGSGRVEWEGYTAHPVYGWYQPAYAGRHARPCPLCRPAESGHTGIF